VCLLPAIEQHGAALLPECEVIRLESDAARVTGVRCRRRGEEFTVRSRIVVLAAGAYRSPILLLASRSDAWPEGLANGSGLVGRNLMVHAGDIVAVRPRRRLSPGGPTKSMSINDFYQYEGTKLGTVQSFGLKITYGYVLYFLRNTLDRHPSKWIRKLRPLLRFVAFVGAVYYRNAAAFASILEDLPYHQNRVVPDESLPNGMRFEYDYPEELARRNQMLRDALRESLGRDHRVVVLSGDRTLNFGHPCGTCRFGDDPATSVLDRHNRAHEVENLYVVDASFFPSSGGTNPSLTIAANALRVAGTIHERLTDE
jgi:choline dehydrogenase-like flavoprotein